MKNKPSGQHRQNCRFRGAVSLAKGSCQTRYLLALCTQNSIYFVPNVPIQGVLEGQSIWVVVKIRVPFGVP